jgi:hypothetical protein
VVTMLTSYVADGRSDHTARHTSIGAYGRALRTDRELGDPRIVRLALNRKKQTGHCGETVDNPGNCSAGWQGSWNGPPAHNLRACIQKCSGCARCRAVSYSEQNRDCSWYHNCALDSLNVHGWAGDSYTTVQVRRMQQLPKVLPGSRCPQLHDKVNRTVRTARLPRNERTAHVITFYSEGQPHDAGLTLTAHAGMLEAAFLPYVASFHAYTATEVRSLQLSTGQLGADVLAPSRFDAPHNPGLAQLGHMAVKPFLLLHRLSALKPNDFLIWLDVNVLKHSELLSGASKLQSTVEWIWNHTLPSTDVFMPFENSKVLIKKHCKTHAVRQLVRHADWPNVFEYPMHQANRIVARKSPAAEVFLRKWLHLCSIREYLEPEPDPQPHPDFLWHTPEQCLFSILAAQQPDMYRRHISFCYNFLPSATRHVFDKDERDRLCHPPDRETRQGWLPKHASRHGRCLAYVCPSYPQEQRCNIDAVRLTWTL